MSFLNKLVRKNPNSDLIGRAFTEGSCFDEEQRAMGGMVGKQLEEIAKEVMALKTNRGQKQKTNQLAKLRELLSGAAASSNHRRDFEGSHVAQK